MAGHNSTAAKGRRAAAAMVRAEKQEREAELRKIVEARHKAERAIVGMGGGGTAVADESGQQTFMVRVPKQKSPVWPMPWGSGMDRCANAQMREVTTWKPRTPQGYAHGTVEEPKKAWRPYARQAPAHEAHAKPLTSVAGGEGSLPFLSPSGIQEARQRRAGRKDSLQKVGEVVHNTVKAKLKFRKLRKKEPPPEDLWAGAKMDGGDLLDHNAQAGPDWSKLGGEPAWFTKAYAKKHNLEACVMANRAH